MHTEFMAQLRRSRLTQSEFARCCGLTVKAVNNWCRGRRKVPLWAWAIARAAEHTRLSTLTAVPDFDWQETLGTWRIEQIARARGRLAKIYHPDLGGNTAAMQRINTAYAAARREMR